MIILISPAKTLDLSKPDRAIRWSQPEFIEKSEKLVEKLRNYSPNQLSRLMKINAKLALLNVERYHSWQMPFEPSNAKQALLCFKGDVYTGIDATNMNDKDLEFAQAHLRILSGLYGILRPLDLMQPYRLEMGTPLKGRGWKNLYEYWKKHITENIKKDSEIADGIVINLASAEYFRAVDIEALNVRTITPDFREYKNGEYKFIHVLGKKARGLMVRYIIKNKIQDPEKLKLFDLEGYLYNDRLSEGDKWVFTRE